MEFVFPRDVFSGRLRSAECRAGGAKLFSAVWRLSSSESFWKVLVGCKSCECFFRSQKIVLVSNIACPTIVRWVLSSFTKLFVQELDSAQKIVLKFLNSFSFQDWVNRCLLITKGALQAHERTTKNFILDQFYLSGQGRRRASKAAWQKTSFHFFHILFYKYCISAACLLKSTASNLHCCFGWL